ncbi:response regulator [Vibrio sp. T187]|uniref:response regulator n=1 Tax=Vibrio TaxID=662 RepID=UPI0010C95C54|nr:MULTISPECIES: response regulator [Vibrio]MBW3698201.1 response regulator [Vibrio sp. T187]
MERQPPYLNEINILIIDDSKTSSMLIKQQLAGLGIKHNNIVTVTSYQETIKAVGLRHYDILIMDYHLEQTLTGHELATLLYKNRLIDTSTGVLIISGDSRQETVLTSLSGKVKHFITKPIKTKDLSDKVNTIYQERELLQQIIRLIKSPSNDLTGQLIDVMTQIDFAISLESSLIDLLIQHDSWQTLSEYMAHSSSPNHPTKQYAYAMLLSQEGNTDEAIKFLSDYILQNPLSLKVMDGLANLYEQQGNYKDALHWALKGFEFTPSISERAIHASQLAAKLNKRDCLIKVGQTFASHLSLADSHWLSSIIEYGHNLETVYLTSERISAKRELLDHFNQFIKAAEKRLTAARKVHLLAYQQIFHSRIWLHEGKLEGAHKKALQAIAPYYDNLSGCPAIVIQETLPILKCFGELWLYKYLAKVLASQPDSPTSALPLPAKAPFDIAQLAALLKEAAEIDSATSNERIIAIYERVIANYPYATEAKMYYLDALRLATEAPNLNPLIVLDTLAEVELPPNWKRWLTVLKKGDISAELPVPFSISL